MNGEASNAFMAELKRHVSSEIQPLRRDVDELAAKLRDVVEALVQADGSLAQRMERLEYITDEEGPRAFAGTLMDGLEDEPSAAQPAPPKRRRWFL